MTIIDTTASPHARLRPVPVNAVKMGNGFWKPRRDANRERGLPRLLELFNEKGVIDNFRRLYGASNSERRMLLFSDSDLYKWLEGAAYTVQNEDAPEIREMMERALEAILPAQEENGYLNTYYVDERAGKRFTNLQDHHELYCAGHMFQAATAHFRATGETHFLEAAVRFADHLVATFGPDGMQGAPGHPEIELALVELYRTTGKRRYLDLAAFFMEQAGFRGAHAYRGHAVRAGYWASGGADVYMETGDPAYAETLRAQWAEMVATRLYLTGATGGRYRGESVGEPFELPNARAYAETCAAFSVAFFAWRMAAIEPDAAFIDVLERSLYNGSLAGIGLSGHEYFYMNPLACSGESYTDPWYAWARRGPYQRVEWHDCTCCPSNAVRLIPSIPGYFYSSDKEGLWVHLYDDNTLTWEAPDGTPFTLTQRTDYPWSGEIEMTIAPEKPAAFAIRARLPGWTPGAAVSVNGEPVGGGSGSYLTLSRTWKAGDTITISMDMPARLMASDPRARENRQSVAIQRGPLVYCMESVDNAFDVYDLRLAPDVEIAAQHRPDFLGGVTVLSGAGAVPQDAESQGPLFRPLEGEAKIALQSVQWEAVPYYAWANRGPARMNVWFLKEE